MPIAPSSSAPFKAAHYSRWNPSGNTTILFEERHPPEMVARALAPSRLNAEQAGFADWAEGRLEMAGGEFCVNAARAFGAHIARMEGMAVRSNMVRVVSVSGWPSDVKLEVTRVNDTEYLVRATLQLVASEEETPDGTVVHLPGISHLLVPGPAPAYDRRAAAFALMEFNGLLDRDACGVVWYTEGDKGPGHYDIVPVVRVRDLDTLVVESSCGSGSMALAVNLYGQADRAGVRSTAFAGTRETGVRYSMGQPSGHTLDVTVTLERTGLVCAVRGDVVFEGEGVFYPDRG